MTALKSSLFTPKFSESKRFGTVRSFLYGLQLIFWATFYWNLFSRYFLSFANSKQRIKSSNNLKEPNDANVCLTTKGGLHRESLAHPEVLRSSVHLVWKKIVGNVFLISLSSIPDTFPTDRPVLGSDARAKMWTIGERYSHTDCRVSHSHQYPRNM